MMIFLGVPKYGTYLGGVVIKSFKYTKENNIQLIFSMLADKVPNSLNNDDNIILRLSQTNKLFKIEVENL